MSMILDCIISPVTIVTSCLDKKINGMTVAWITQVSFEPTMLMVSIAPERFTHHLIEKSNVFTVNILSENQILVAKDFGFKSGIDTDKFKGIAHKIGKNGCPILDDVHAYLECSVVSSLRAGDHTIFTGKITESNVFKNLKPLVFRSSDFF